MAVADRTEPDEPLTKEEPWPSPIKPWLCPSRRSITYAALPHRHGGDHRQPMNECLPRHLGKDENPR
jgi:hypothetical protein